MSDTTDQTVATPDTPEQDAADTKTAAGVVDAPSPSAPADNVDSNGLTPEQHEADTTPEEQGKYQDQSLQGALDLLANDIKDVTPEKSELVGTITLDFGDAGQLTGCLIMSNSSADPSGEQVVAVPYQGGYVQIHGVPASAVK